MTVLILEQLVISPVGVYVVVRQNGPAPALDEFLVTLPGVFGHRRWGTEVDHIPAAIGRLRGLLPQQDRPACGVIPNLHPQQLADGADGKIVGLAAGFVGVEDGAGDLLSVGGGDVLARRDFLRSVQGHIGKVIAHRARGSQGGGQAGGQGQSRGESANKCTDAFVFFHMALLT